MHDFKGKGITKVVSSREVEDATSQGYELVGVYQENSDSLCNDEVPDPNAGYSGVTITVDKHLPCTNTYFIMRLDEKSSVAHLSKEVKELDELVTTQTNIGADLNKKIELFKAENAKHKLLWEECKTILDQEVEKCNSLAEVKRKMETNIGKIQEALGIQKMNEILEVE